MSAFNSDGWWKPAVYQINWDGSVDLTDVFIAEGEAKTLAQGVIDSLFPELQEAILLQVSDATQQTNLLGLVATYKAQQQAFVDGQAFTLYKVKRLKHTKKLPTGQPFE